MGSKRVACQTAKQKGCVLPLWVQAHSPSSRRGGMTMFLSSHQSLPNNRLELMPDTHSTRMRAEACGWSALGESWDQAEGVIGNRSGVGTGTRHVSTPTRTPVGQGRCLS